VTARIALGLAVALAGGCMTIYPDPELPDVVVEWTTGDACTDGVASVRVEVLDADPALPAIAQDFPCADGVGRVEDVARTRHDVRVALLDGAQAIVARAAPFAVDLRDGASRREQVWLFYRDEGLFAISWRFAGGESCASLGLMFLQINAYPDDPLLGQWGFGATCEPGELGELDYYPSLLAGTYTFQIIGTVEMTGELVAASMRIADQVIPDRGELVDLGTVELTRCPPCDVEPPPPPP
jgi:hypothetical protein